MGLESANYKILFKSEDLEKITREIQDTIGAVRIEKNNDSLTSFVLKSDESLIDFQIIPADAGGQTRLSLRLALCNPAKSIEIVLSIINVILSKYDATALDEAVGKYILKLSELDKKEIRDSFRRRKSDFQKWFGNFTAPLSADDVFDYIREMKREK